MSMLFERLMCINYHVCDGYYQTTIRENLSIYANINSAIKWNVLNREHA